MIRTQIQLTPEQARRVRRLARQRGTSMAAVIRSLVEEGTAAAGGSRAEAYRAASAIVGRFPDRQGARDLARQHDRYLDEAYE